MKKVRWFILLTGLVLSAVVIRPCVNAEYVNEQRDTLRSIRDMGIHISLQGDIEGKKLDVLVDKLRTDIELKFRKIGINVKNITYANFEVLIDLIYEKNLKIYIYSIRVGLAQPVSIVRNPNLSCIAFTWNTSMHGIINEMQLEDKMRKNLNGLSDFFLNDYLTVNSKK